MFRSNANTNRATARRIVLVLLALMASVGCARPVKICPTSGTLTVNGQPTAGAYVVFQALNDPKREQSPDTARTQKDGSFTARVRGPGEYAVTVFWPSVTEEDGEVVEGEDYFQGKYRQPEQSVTRVTISNGDNTLPPISLMYP